MFNYRSPLKFSAVAGILIAYSQSAHAEWIICNRTGQQLLVAIAYNEPPHPGIAELLSQGWWRVNACGGCVTVLQKQETSVYNEAYLRAEMDGGAEFIGGGYKFCVTDQRFKIRSTSSNCTLRGFQKEQIDLNKHWTTNITGGRRSCID